MIKRNYYIEILKKYIDMPLVKILAGIRRCGKSTILEMLKEELLKNGVKQENIIHISYTSLEKIEISTAKKMFDEINSLLKNKNKYYILLDELQEIKGWEKVVNTLLEQKNVDIYITGSNSKLMSSEISTYLTGRYVTIPVYTLSFKEFLDFKKDSKLTKKELFNQYIRLGGFPLIAQGDYTEQVAYTIVEDIYNSVILNDISKKHSIQNIDMFERVVKFVIENVGKTFSANTILNFFKSENRKISIEAIYNYLEWLEKAFIVYRCSRYDLQGKSILKTQEKFFIADSSIKYCKVGYNPTSVASMLENIVFFELKRRGYDVFIGKNQEKEIDFVASKRDEKIYVQVCKEMPKNSDREIKNLLDIKDTYPKYILTLDDFAVGNIQGVKIKNIIDFLVE
ncbi:MAG: ATP-binding protein [Clostridia bacterium]|nr:ATP-binding protein [Clostridia bacterium]